MTFFFDDRYRWLKFGLAVVLLAALGVACGLAVPVIRPSVLRLSLIHI